MRVIAITLIAGSLCALGCSDPPPPPNNRIACDTLSFCRISASGFSCDSDKSSVCAQCINDTACGDILYGHACDYPCPGVVFKPK